MGSESTKIQIKGIREGLLGIFDDSDWETLTNTFITQIDGKPEFYQSARLALDVGNHELRVAELIPMRDLLSERGITLWAVLSTSDVTIQTAQNLGLATRLSKPKPVEVREPLEAIQDDRAMWIEHTIRSGTRIEYDGNVVVVGDVNPGAEVLAGGSIMVWGRLRGLVHAGAGGDEKAMVAAIELSPTQLRIANAIAVSPKKKGDAGMEVARLVNGNIIAESWKSG